MAQDPNVTPNPVPELVFDQADIDKNKTMAGLAYIIFFLPLIACPDSRFAKFHANQSLIICLAALASAILSGILAFTIIVPLLLFVVNIALFVFAIMGLINGFKGVAKPLPLISKIPLTLIKY